MIVILNTSLHLKQLNIKLPSGVFGDKTNDNLDVSSSPSVSELHFSFSFFAFGGLVNLGFSSCESVSESFFDLFLFGFCGLLNAKNGKVYDAFTLYNFVSTN